MVESAVFDKRLFEIYYEMYVISIDVRPLQMELDESRKICL